MKVSFLVTYYNQKQYVADSLNSILAINKPCDWEIIVGDDGSSDGTIETVQKYIEKYPENIFLYVMPREKDKKYDLVKRASANRLNIFEHATGDLFCTLDGDDFYCDTEFIKDAIEIYEKDKNLSIVAFGYRYYANGILGEEKTIPAEESEYVDKRMYLNTCYIPAGACVFKRKWEEGRLEYIKSIGYFDDNDILMNNLNYGEMYSARRAVYAYRQTGNSLYTGMSVIEQAVLNVQGIGIDLKIIPYKYRNSLYFRNADSVLYMYICRKKLKDLLGSEKYDMYLYGCKEIGASLGYKMMIWNTLSLKQKKSVKRIIRRLRRDKNILYAKMIIKYYSIKFLKIFKMKD